LVPLPLFCLHLPPQYESLQHAITATVEVYVALLLQLVQQRKLHIYVHPIPPVLDETRDVVKSFDAALQQRLTAVLQWQPELNGQLAYLDFFYDLLTADGSSLQPQLAFDGTHLHPRYLEHLEAALNAVRAAEAGS
jgi:lysophospholipase L1-like esterase